MPNESTPTDDQFLSAASFLSSGLRRFDQALKQAGGHNEHTDTVRAHIAGARWMYEALFGVDIPPAGPRVDAHGKTHG
jgi:hypothetical protein